MRRHKDVNKGEGSGANERTSGKNIAIIRAFGHANRLFEIELFVAGVPRAPRRTRAERPQ
jgi:hypothetical protein